MRLHCARRSASAAVAAVALLCVLGLQHELHTESDQSARDHRTSDDRGGANSSRADGGGL